MHVSFSYKSTDSADTIPDQACNPAHIVDVVGFVHCTKSILENSGHDHMFVDSSLFNFKTHVS